MTDDRLREYRKVHLVDHEVGTIKECGYSHTKEQRTNYAIDDEHGLEGLCTKQIAQFILKLIAHRLNHKREQYYHPNPISSTKACAIEQRERSEEGSTKCYQCGECKLPLATCGVDKQTTLSLCASEREQHRVSSLNKHQEYQQCT